MGQLEGKTGIITGAASGIGAACAHVLAHEGAKLLLTDLDDAAGRRVAEETGSLYQHLDVTDEAAWPGVISAAEQRLGGLHSWWRMPASASWGRRSTCRWPTGEGRWR